MKCIKKTNSKNIIELLKNRGVDNIENILHPTANNLCPLTDLDNLEEGYLLLKRHLQSNILLVVDSDVDGYTSAAITYLYLKKSYPNIKIDYILHTGKQHGLEDHIDMLLEERQYDLIIIPDASSNDYDYCLALAEQGAEVLCLDHHELDKEVAPNMVLINNQVSKKYANKNLTGAGVVWRFCQYCDTMNKTNYADDLIDLAALGILSDMGSVLQEENRYIIYKGLQNIKSAFFQALLKKQEFSTKGKINAMSVTFYITPLINALIRISDLFEKEIVFRSFIEPNELIESQKRGEKGQLTQIINEGVRYCVNAKAKQKRLLDPAMVSIDKRIQENNLDEHKIIIVELTEDDNFPSTLNGLIATRIVAKYKKPTMLVRLNSEGYLRGSMRGVNDSELDSFKDFLLESQLCEYVQGHANSAGCSVFSNNKDELLHYADDELSNVDFYNNIYEYDYECEDFNELIDFIYELDKYDDLWGQGNKTPLIYIPNLFLTKNQFQIIGSKKDTLRIDLNHSSIKLIMFKAEDIIQKIKQYGEEEIIACEVIGTGIVNVWGSTSTPQIQIKDIEFMKSTDNILEF